MTESMVQRFTPELPPDWQRGSLRRAAADAASSTPRARCTPDEVEVWYLPAASDFARDRALTNPILLIEELKAQGAAEDLIGRCAAARVRRRGRGGRHRGGGSFELLFLAFVDNGFTSRQRFATKLTPDLARSCGFDTVPSAWSINERFAELELDWTEFRSTKNVFVRACVAADPRIADAISIDATLLRSAFRLEPMARGSGRSREKRSGARRDDWLLQSAADAIDEAHMAELDDPSWGDDDAPEQTRARLEEQLRVRSPNGRTAIYSLFQYGDTVHRSLDVHAGLRAYRNTRTVVYGYYGLSGSSVLVGEAVDVVHFPADVNEYDGIPELDAALVEALARRWSVVGGDRGLFLRLGNEFWAKRRTGIVTPRRTKVGTSSVERLAGALFDEHGVPRCPACGAPGNQAYPGLGLQARHSVPVIQFRCVAQLTPGCARTYTIRCDLEYLLLTAPSRLRESFHTLRERQSNLEHGFRHNRQRFRLGGKELADCLPYPGIAAHQLRTQAALLMLWARIGLRNGWIAPVLLEPRLNQHAPVQLSARQDRRSLEIIRAGTGTPRLYDLLRQREEKSLHLPSGPAYDRYLDQA